MKTKDIAALEDRQLNQARSNLDPVDQPVRTARTNEHHYSDTQYCSIQTVLLIFLFLQTNITSQTWPSESKEGIQMFKSYDHL